MENYSLIYELNRREKPKPKINKNCISYYRSGQKREQLVHWLIESVSQPNVKLKTIELSVLYIDHFLNTNSIQDSYLQLLALSAFNLASKFFQKGFTKQTRIQSIYQDQEYEDMEILILKTMQYQLNQVTSSDYAEILGLNLKDECVRSYFIYILIDYDIYKFKHLELTLAVLLLTKPGQYQLQPNIYKIAQIIQNSLCQQEKIIDIQEEVQKRRIQNRIKRVKRIQGIRKYLAKK